MHYRDIFSQTLISSNHTDNYKMRIESLINYVSSLSNISDSEIRLLTKFFKTANFSKASILEKEDKIAQKLYFVTSGFIRTFFNEDGIEITTQIAGENNFITSFNSFVSSVISKDNIQCISDCKVLYITKSD